MANMQGCTPYSYTTQSGIFDLCIDTGLPTHLSSRKYGCPREVQSSTPFCSRNV